ncbi:DUF1517 domain-containing protein [Roseofilum capinflatum]|uniref:DUF1517 domain-containing protein n=1 Tax=Roseofilum capinflatum BLCC-M114 TaxID=3022440 RepID=A0ABT7B6I4_9CYAN|nr:DUF1517 domain-containing protein [Roseofilum capinflatum]MDJ1174775.1 DUF1517 domain-containing protein [Roseofilum capinflatum BLCC-M114]
MKNRSWLNRKTAWKSLVLMVLMVALTFGSASSALAARSGGRIGGGSFRAPSRSYSAPSRTYTGGGYGFGGGFGFPFLLPFFGFGGGFGGLFTILIFVAIANFLMQTVRRLNDGDGEMLTGSSNPTASVAQVQVGLLADARSLQTDLDRIAETSDPSTGSGRAQILQEATLSLLRHPEYWVYGSAESSPGRLDTAEAKFNEFSIAERSKFTEETLSNYNNQLKQAESKGALPGDATDELEQASGDYIVVTLVAATFGKLELPTINGSQDLRRALSQIGSLGEENLLAIEVLWTPQASGDTLTSDDILAAYPNLKLV